MAGPKCFMKKPAAVWAMLSVERYHERWPLIPLEELHKRRLGPDIISGQSPAAVCSQCADAFSPSRPRVCKYALANDLWLGRPDPLLWNDDMTHEMRLALARTVATKVVLRAGGAAQQEPISGQRPRAESKAQSLARLRRLLLVPVHSRRPQEFRVVARVVPHLRPRDNLRT